MNPAKKLAGYLSIMPVASGVTAPSTGGTGTTSGTDTGTDTSTDEPVDGSDTTLGGCSTGGSAGGLATFFLIGLAAFIRRRR
jgi:uncharacterized protein (TIGR03382 family)